LLTIIVAARGNSSCNFQFFLFPVITYVTHHRRNSQKYNMTITGTLNRLKRQAEVENRACNLVLLTYINI
jgi:hypothetical protein